MELAGWNILRCYVPGIRRFQNIQTSNICHWEYQAGYNSSKTSDRTETYKRTNMVCQVRHVVYSNELLLTFFVHPTGTHKGWGRERTIRRLMAPEIRCFRQPLANGNLEVFFFYFVIILAQKKMRIIFILYLTDQVDFAKPSLWAEIALTQSPARLTCDCKIWYDN